MAATSARRQLAAHSHHQTSRHPASDFDSINSVNGRCDDRLWLLMIAQVG
jgi:hypothetical protein